MGINAIAIDATDGSCGMLKIETQGDFEVSEAIKNLLIGTRVEPRPYQGRIVTKTVDMYRGRYVNMAGENEPNAKSIMIESPTGSGKTVMGLVAAKYLQSELRMEGRKLAVGWMAMRRNLLSQTAAENAMHCADNPNGKSIGVNNLFMVSMFQRSPDDLLAKRKEGYEIMLVTDECLAGETLVNTLVNDKQVLVPIEEIVNSGVGTHVLSYDLTTDKLEWMPIEGRTCTGEKPVFEIEIETEDGRTVIVVATANHRFFTGEDYQRVDELSAGDTVFVLKDHVDDHANTQEPQHDEQGTLPTTA